MREREERGEGVGREGRWERGRGRERGREEGGREEGVNRSIPKHVCILTLYV